MSTDDETTEHDPLAEEAKRDVFELDFGRVIARERSRRGWSAEEAARRADLAPKTWLRLENGKPVRNRTYLSVDELFDLPKGTTLRAWQESGDLQAELDRVQIEEARARHPQMAARVAAELASDEDDGAFGLVRGFRHMATSGQPIGIRSPVGSDRALLMEAVSRLGLLADDDRGREALKTLVPVAFAGIVNEWNDLYDEHGNLLGDRRKPEDDGQR